MKFFQALPLLSSLFVLPKVAPAEYVFTSFTEASERDMYVWGSTNATTWDLIKGPAYVRPPPSLYYLAQPTDCSYRLPPQDSYETPA